MRQVVALAAAVAVVLAAALLGGRQGGGGGSARLALSPEELPAVGLPDSSSLELALEGVAAAEACPAGGLEAGSRARLGEALEQSVGLAAAFMTEHQREDGRFTYEYDWRSGAETEADSQVRQAGAAWGLALLHLHRPALEPRRVRGAALKALAFFERNSRLDAAGRARYVAYPGDAEGSLGTVALVTLAHVDLLRALEAAGEGGGAEAARLYARLSEYAHFLLVAWRADGSFFSRYSLGTGAPHGAPSPYFDGEALLALVKAARYLDPARSGLDAGGALDDAARWRLLARGADAGYTRHVADPLEDDADSSTTKGYYQWSSMLFYELATAGRPASEVDAPRYAGYVRRLAAWMIDVHATLSRRRNTGYAYEGIAHAYALARDAGADAEAGRLACVMEQGMRKLTSWQVGHPLADKLRTGDGKAEAHPRARGGIQNHAYESTLRIDVAQHQLHAALLVQQLYVGRA